jgi:hypothetical protein
MNTAMLIGVVENIEFTYGGAGNQWTTIDGIVYATYWDAGTIDWKIGDTVAFTTYRRKFWDNVPGPKVLHAMGIHKTEMRAA